MQGRLYYNQFLWETRVCVCVCLTLWRARVRVGGETLCGSQAFKVEMKLKKKNTVG